MFTEMLQAEVWRRRLETAGYRVLPEARTRAHEVQPRETPEQDTEPRHATNRVDGGF